VGCSELEDFDRDRILLLEPTSHGVEKVKLSRNGKEIVMPTSDPVKLRIAGIHITPEEKVSDYENVTDQIIGYWGNLEVTYQYL
jgi:hypothetical protein